LRRFGVRAGMVAACLLGLAGLAGLAGTSAGATTVPTPSPASSAVTVVPDALAPDVLSPEAAKAMDLPPGTQACPVPASLLQMQCMVLVSHSKEPAGTAIRPGSAATRDLTPVNDALGPPELQVAYGLAGATGASATDGAGQTVAIVDAYGDPHVRSDLAKYRANWSLPACSGSGAGCLTVFNQNGTTSALPAAPAGENLTWEDETALDVEMVSAICPKCAIDLFEANSAYLGDLGTAENSAAKVTHFISNSWGAFEDFPGESTYDGMYFNHPGVAIDFASGDSGFGGIYPAASQLVTSVGGTYLTTSSGSAPGYAETVWNGQNSAPGSGTGGGCSAGEGKPSWETDSGCLNRTENDVAAVANAPKGIDEYSGSGDCSAKNGAFGEADDCAVYGTSVATPIITAIYALAGTPAPNTYPVSYLYQSGHAGDLNHVASGQAGTCEANRLYLCNAGDSLGNGYNGPAGLGTPKGVAAFQSSATGDIVSAVNPGTYDLRAGVPVSLPAIKAYDSASGQALAYSASGLPSGLSINSDTGAISGTLSATPVNDKVRVTVKEKAGTGASATIGFGIATVKAMGTDYHPGFGEVKLDLGGKCMNDGYNDTHVDAPISIYPCQVSSSQNWSYSMPPGPGSAGRISIHGMCLYVLGKTNSAGHHLIGLANCANSSALLWVLTGYAGAIVNPATGDCITDPNSSSVNNTQLTAQPCTTTTNQAWTMPASPVTSGIAGKCLAVSGGSAISTACSGSTAQQVTLGLDGSLRFGGYCLYNAGGAGIDGTAIKELGCDSSSAELWGISAYGQIQNLLSRKCLAIPGNSSANGAKLELEDCYGQPGEVWAAS
jgi:Ricin-type beta-trefoil lectin domain/Putative Ig domain